MILLAGAILVSGVLPDASGRATEGDLVRRAAGLDTINTARYGPPLVASSSRGGGHEGVLIAEVYYHSYRDNEYVVLRNEGRGPVDLTGWDLSDGEGRWKFPPGTKLEVNEEILVTENATALEKDSGLRADLCVTGCSRPVRDLGSFVLANQGDGVLLLDADGQIADALYYGSSTPGLGWEGEGMPLLGRGEVARRRGEGGLLLDTNTSEDWLWTRPFRLGHGQRPVVEFDEVLVRPYISPEQSLSLVLSTVEAAQREIELYGFELTSPRLIGALEAALARGVELRLGLEANPPGGMEESQEADLKRLATRGAQVYLMGPGPESSFRRYAYHHAKYVVVDETWVVLGSENFSKDGFPDGGPGNRGWGVVAYAPALAEYLLEVARRDWDPGRSDVHPLQAPGEPCERCYPSLGRSLDLQGFEEATTRLILSPDNSMGEGGVADVIGGAEESLDVELFYLRWYWKGQVSPLVRALLEAAGRGVKVRVLLDANGYNVESEDDNDEVAVRLNRLASGRDLPLQARLFPPGQEGPLKIHNKGLVKDSEEVLVSSMNWNYHGAYLNREVGLHLSSPNLASAFTTAFLEDWERGYEPLGISIEGPREVHVGSEVVFVATPVVEEGVALTFLWDLHADGLIEGSQQTFRFAPKEPGGYLIRLQVMFGDGGMEEAEVLVLATEPWPLPLSLELLVGMSSAASAALLFGWLRMGRERTNKRDQMRTCGSPPPDLRGRD